MKAELIAAAIAVVIFGLMGAAVSALGGCSPALGQLDDPAVIDDANKLAKCREEGRAAKADAGADAGWEAYVTCKKDAGF